MSQKQWSDQSDFAYWMVSLCEPIINQTSDLPASQSADVITPGQENLILIKVDFSKETRRPEGSDTVFSKVTKKTQDPFNIISCRKDKDSKAFLDRHGHMCWKSQFEDQREENWETILQFQTKLKPTPLQKKRKEKIRKKRERQKDPR